MNQILILNNKFRTKQQIDHKKTWFKFDRLLMSDKQLITTRICLETDSAPLPWACM